MTGHTLCGAWLVILTRIRPKDFDIQLRLKYQILFGIYALLVFLAYMQPIELSVFEPSRSGGRKSVWVQGLYLSAWIAPALPFVVAGCVFLGLRQIPVGCTSFLAWFSLVAGLLLTFIGMVFSLGSHTQFLHGVTLTIAVASSVLIWSGSGGKPQPTRVAKIGVTIGTIASLWSLLTVPMILVQAHVIADGSPYCIAEHTKNSEIKALRDLRGFSFYTTKTGYKSTSA